MAVKLVGDEQVVIRHFLNPSLMAPMVIEKITTAGFQLRQGTGSLVPVSPTTGCDNIDVKDDDVRGTGASNEQVALLCGDFPNYWR